MADRRSRRIPEATVARLPLYQRILLALAESRIPTVSSEVLGELAGFNAAKVRKDLSHLGTYGTRGSGYEVQLLLGEIARELGADRDWPLLIAGMGNLGTALANSRGFSSNGFRVAALVDADPTKVGRLVGGIRISGIEDLEAVVVDQAVSIAVVTTPAAVAQGVVDRLVGVGVTSILNFAPAVLGVPEHVVLRQVDLSVQLQVLGFYQSRLGGAPSGIETADEHGQAGGSGPAKDPVGAH